MVMPDRADVRSVPEGEDVVDQIIKRHRQQRPDIDPSPFGIVGRVVRVSRLFDQQMRVLLAAHGMEAWEFDVLASLRRTDPPHRLTAGRLGKVMMLSPGALTNRVDRLVARGLVTRDVDPGNRRQVLIGLTDEGAGVADRLRDVVAAGHQQILSGLSPEQRDSLAGNLRRLLLSLGDRPGADHQAPVQPATDDPATAGTG
jgi:DNA-binding MarR family transcriptional regulator